MTKQEEMKMLAEGARVESEIVRTLAAAHGPLDLNNLDPEPTEAERAHWAYREQLIRLAFAQQKIGDRDGMIELFAAAGAVEGRDFDTLD